ncbi:MAG: DNRLRE domain-containing protein [Acidobacteria bacterium]|nr:DNRLRE domain-containing protein [Acidobacteriota bacterium]
MSGMLWLLVFAATGAWTAASAQQTKVLEASKDNTLIESSGITLKSGTNSAGGQSDVLSNGRGPAIFVGRTGQTLNSIRRGLIAFDIAGSIPAGSRIISVRLSLTATMRAGERAPSKISVHRLLADWGEGNSSTDGGRGAPAEAGDATWFHAIYPDRLWAHPGGDFVARQSSVRAVKAEGTVVWASTRQLVADVQSWLNSPEKNYGWLLRGDETRGATAIVFRSHEETDAAVRPQLTVTYRPPSRRGRK